MEKQFHPGLTLYLLAAVLTGVSLLSVGCSRSANPPPAAMSTLPAAEQAQRVKMEQQRPSKADDPAGPGMPPPGPR